MPSAARRQAEWADAISTGNLKPIDYGPVSSEVFNTDLFTPTQTAYVLALYFDLLSDKMRAHAVEELVADIERRGLHLSTGFGATTIWERWDGWTEENGFQSTQMNSFNHYAYGAIGAWLYNTVAGIEIDPLAPGYKHIILRPQPGGALTEARGKLLTLYGEVVSDWKLKQGKFEWTIVVPPNTTATVHLPAGIERTMTMNGQAVSGLVHDVEAGEYLLVVS